MTTKKPTTKLHPELRRHIVDVFGSKRISHYLINTPQPSTPEEIEACNNLLISKDNKFKQAIKDNDWDRFIELIEEPWRLQYFYAYSHLIDQPADYWRILSNLWINFHSIFEKIHIFDRLFNSHNPDRHCLMNTEERAGLASMPDAIEIWRGGRTNEPGWSWSVNPEIAKWFAIFFGNDYLVHAYCNKTDVIAYFDRRREQEIVVPPGTVFNISSSCVSSELKKYEGVSFHQAFPLHNNSNLQL